MSAIAALHKTLAEEPISDRAARDLWEGLSYLIGKVEDRSLYDQYAAWSAVRAYCDEKLKELPKR